MSGAVPCLSTDRTTHAVPHFIQLCKWEGARVCASQPAIGYDPEAHWEGCMRVREKKTSCYTPGSDEHGPRFLTGGPGAAPGGVASKNGWVYMRVQGGFISYSYFVRLSVCVH